MDVSAMKSLYQVFIRLFDNDLILQNIFTLIFKLTNKKKLNIFDNIQGVVALIMAHAKRQLLDDKDKTEILMIAKWMHCISIKLNKENSFQDFD